MSALLPIPWTRPSCATWTPHACSPPLQAEMVAGGSMERTSCSSLAASWNGRDSPSRHSVTEGSRRVEEHPTKFPGCSASRRTFPSRCPCRGRTAVDTLRLHYPRLLPHNEAKQNVRYVPRCQDSQASGGGGTGCTPSSCGCASECRCL